MSIRQDAGAREGWPERVTRRGKRVSTAFRVRYAETDQMGMAYYANYLVWFEVMRGDFMRAIGLPYSQLEAEGWNLPIAEAHVRYLAPARYDDAVEVEAGITRLRSRVIRFEYAVRRGTDLLATGYTVHVPVDDRGKPKALADATLAALAPWVLESPD